MKSGKGVMGKEEGKMGVEYREGVCEWKEGH